MATKTYYSNATSFNGYTNGANAENDSTANYAYSQSSAVRYSGNNCPSTNYGTITAVYLVPYQRVTDTNVSYQQIFHPYFAVWPNSPGDSHYITYSAAATEPSINITSDTNAPGSWAWSNVAAMDCAVSAHVRAGELCYLWRTRILVTYTPVASTLAWSSPAAASTHYRVGTGIAIAGTAANINGVAKVQYNVNGGSWVDCTGTTSWSAIVPQSSLSYGAFTINTRVQDSSTDSVWTTTTARAFAQSSLPSQII